MKYLILCLALSSFSVSVLSNETKGVDCDGCKKCRETNPVCLGTSIGQSRKIERKEARLEKRAARKAARASRAQKG